MINQIATSFLTIFLTFSSINILKAQISVKPESHTARGMVNEMILFKVLSTNSNPVNYTFSYGNNRFSRPLSSGVVNNMSNGNSTLQLNPTIPAFVACSVTQDNQKAATVIAIDPAYLHPTEDEPADFDDYWNSRKQELAAIPLSVQLAPHSSTQYVDVYNYNVNLTEGRKAYGYLSIPKGVNGPFPAVIQLPPYGNSANLVSPTELSLAERGGVISIYLNIHNNEPTSQGPDDYIWLNINQPDQYYLKYAILGAIKTIDYLQTRADFNGQVGVVGVSQGGGLSLLTAGLDNRISLLFNSHSALCEHAGAKYGAASGFPSYYQLASNLSLDPEKVLKTAKYYDAAYAAKRFKGVSWTVVGYNDTICLPATTYTAYNQLNGFKIMQHDLNKGHEDGSDELFNPQHPVGLYAMMRRFFPATNTTAPWPWNTTTNGFYINAGNDKTIYTDTTTLIAQFGVENIPLTNMHVYWELISGPEKVVFEDYSKTQTKVKFNAPGIYRLRFYADDTTVLSAQNKYYTLSNDVNITVAPLVVPVELLNFEGKILEHKNTLSWQTTIEHDYKGFDIERSIDAQNWYSIGWYDAKRQSNEKTNYSFDDNAPLSIAYYRLQQMNIDGKKSLSKIINLTRKETLPTIKIQPNPTSNWLFIEGDDFENSSIQVVDMMGKVWISETIQGKIPPLSTEQLPTGTYVLWIKNKQTMSHLQFVKILF
jgi:cephalosporin-C deacetylase-like acetyl esterase